MVAQLDGECLRVGADWFSRVDLVLGPVEVLEQVVNLPQRLSTETQTGT